LCLINLKSAVYSSFRLRELQFDFEVCRGEWGEWGEWGEYLQAPTNLITKESAVIQALSPIGEPRGVDVLIDVVGIAIANHCQGNVRRVAARGLGQIGLGVQDEQILAKVLDKLHWALISPEDWALRYAAAVSLEEIGVAKKSNSSLSAKIIAMLEGNLLKQTDDLVQLREKKALSKLAQGALNQFSS
jgi:hypothetical protein